MDNPINPTCIFSDTGIVCDFGIDESLLPKMIDMARINYSQKGISAVKNWIWWDLEVSAEDCSRFHGIGLQPAIIFAHHLISDSRDRWREGSNVSRFIHKMSHRTPVI